MDHKLQEEVSNLTLSKSFKFPNNGNVESGIANLIEAAEMLRRNKIETNQSYSDVFFSSVKQYIG